MPPYTDPKEIMAGTREPTPAQVAAHARYCSICTSQVVRVFNDMISRGDKPGAILSFAAEQGITRMSYEAINKHRAYLKYLVVDPGSPVFTAITSAISSPEVAEQVDEQIVRILATVEERSEAIKNISVDLWYTLALLTTEIQARVPKAPMSDLVKAAEVLGKIALLVAGQPTEITSKGKTDHKIPDAHVDSKQDLEEAFALLRQGRTDRLMGVAKDVTPTDTGGVN